MRDFGINWSYSDVCFLFACVICEFSFVLLKFTRLKVSTHRIFVVIL